MRVDAGRSRNGGLLGFGVGVGELDVVEGQICESSPGTQTALPLGFVLLDREILILFVLFGDNGRTEP